MDAELGLKINKYIHDQCKNGVPHDIGFNIVKLFCEPVVVGRSEHCDHPIEKREFIGSNLLRCKICGKEFH